jgi:hypothetical protein
MVSHLKRRALPVARHECGHYVVARVLNFIVSGPQLVLHLGGHRGESEIQLHMSASTVDEIVKYAEGRAQALAAGVLAESLDHGRLNIPKAINLFKDTGATQDYAKYREMIYLIRNIKYGPETENNVKSQLQELDSKMWNDAAKLVELDHAIIEELAEMLADKATLVDQKVGLTSSEISSLASIQARFASRNHAPADQTPSQSRAP